MNKKNNMQHIPGLGVGLGINYSLHRQKKKKDFFLHFSIKPGNMHASYDLKKIKIKNSALMLWNKLLRS